MQVEYIKFSTRQIRAAYIAKRYAPLLKGRVLDVGCFEADLKGLIGKDVDYVGIDIAGKPDIEINLEKVDRLPFEDNAFDCVVCTDVLEHIDNLHHMFGELVRVSKKHVIISLPNCWVNARQPIDRGKGSFSHYGLPIERPLDRHKWFFSIDDIKAFFRAQQERYSIEIMEEHVTEKPRLSPLRLARRLRYPNQSQYLNRYAHTLWTVFDVSE